MATAPQYEAVIPIFDSLTHPFLDGSWISSRRDLANNSFENTVECLSQAGVRWAWAIAMGNAGGFEPYRYIEACTAATVKLLPAAFLRPDDFTSEAHIEDWLATCQSQGFRGIKLHPRLGGFDFLHPNLAAIITASNRIGLIPFLCTYCYSASPGGETLTIENLRTLLHAVPDEKLVLLHGGTTRLLELAEITRHFKKTLLDVSWTLCEYAGSSLDMDLRYIFDRCSHRICIGSDAPEFSPLQMRDRFEQLTTGLSQAHRERIAFRNLLAFSGLSGTT